MEKTIHTLEKENEILREENRILKKTNTALQKSLGKGIWGLEEKKDLNHDEIVFLFARYFHALGFDSIRRIEQSFPDCTAIKEGKEVFIEFEPKLSAFDHVHKHDISKCNYVVCWEDDWDEISKVPLKENEISIIELRSFWKTGKGGKKISVYTQEDFERMHRNQLIVLNAFIEKDKETLSKEELSESTKKLGLEGKALGGALSGFAQKEGKEWIIKRKMKNEYRFNITYKDILKTILPNLID